MIMKTTFQKIRSFQPWESDWKKLLAYHKPKSLNDEISLKDIIESNGIKDAVWALRATDNKKSIILFCADVAESVLHIYENKHPNNFSVRDCIEACRKYANDEISRAELIVKKKAADDYVYVDVDSDAVHAIHAAVYAADAAIYVDADAAYTAIIYAIYATKNTWNEITKITDIFLKYF